MPELTVALVGYELRGVATIRCWDGFVGDIPMKATRFAALPTAEAIGEAVNDGGFGAEAVLSAEYDLWALYEHGAEQLVDSGIIDDWVSLAYAKRGM